MSPSRPPVIRPTAKVNAYPATTSSASAKLAPSVLRMLGMATLTIELSMIVTKLPVSITIRAT